MTTGADVFAEAETWERTPFVWQASLKGKGCDCKGLIWGVAREVGLPEADSLYARIVDYSARVPVALLRRGLQATLTQVRAPDIGDLLLLRVAEKAQHLAFFGGGDVIHTYSGKWVTKTDYRAALKVWPLDSIWRFPSLTRSEVGA